MASDVRQTDLPVLLLHNLDPAWGPEDTGSVRDAVGQLIAALSAQGHRVIEVPVVSADLESALAPFDPAGHIVLNWCEELPGWPHSDVYVVRVLEQQGFTYTGCTAEVLSMSWDKAAVKTLLAGNQIPTPRWRVFDADATEQWQGYPAIVKPACEHCSLGVDTNAVVLDPAALRHRVAYVRANFRQPAMVEDFIDGREFHVTLWGNGKVRMLPPAEMDFSAFSDVRERLCTYDAKFTPGSSHYEGIELLIPAVLTQVDLAAIVRTAIRAYRVVGCRDYARIDLRLRDGIFYVLDVNPNPDISPDTSFAYCAEAEGMSYGAFASRLVNLAAARHPLSRRATVCTGRSPLPAWAPA